VYTIISIVAIHRCPAASLGIIAVSIGISASGTTSILIRPHINPCTLGPDVTVYVSRGCPICCACINTGRTGSQVIIPTTYELRVGVNITGSNPAPLDVGKSEIEVASWMKGNFIRTAASGIPPQNTIEHYG